jgi:hypothetical protein
MFWGKGGRRKKVRQKERQREKEGKKMLEIEKKSQWPKIMFVEGEGGWWRGEWGEK